MWNFFCFLNVDKPCVFACGQAVRPWCCMSGSIQDVVDVRRHVEYIILVHERGMHTVVLCFGAQSTATTRRKRRWERDVARLIYSFFLFFIDLNLNQRSHTQHFCRNGARILGHTEKNSSPSPPPPLLRCLPAIQCENTLFPKKRVPAFHYQKWKREKNMFFR